METDITFASFCVFARTDVFDQFIDFKALIKQSINLFLSKSGSLMQALFLCNICVVFKPVVPFGNLLFIHASTNATDDHKYSPLPSADFDSSAVLV